MKRLGWFAAQIEAVKPWPGVYAMYRGGKLVYIGMNVNVLQRLRQHCHTWEGLKVRYCDQRIVTWPKIEARLIRRLRPPRNIQGKGPGTRLAAPRRPRMACERCGSRAQVLECFPYSKPVDNRWRFSCYSCDEDKYPYWIQLRALRREKEREEWKRHIVSKEWHDRASWHAALERISVSS